MIFFSNFLFIRVREGLEAVESWFRRVRVLLSRCVGWSEERGGVYRVLFCYLGCVKIKRGVGGKWVGMWVRKK